jgi:GTP-binding protein
MDTGGLDGCDIEFGALIKEQTYSAMHEADILGLVVDARTGLTHQDEHIARYIRSLNKPTILIINKTEGSFSPDRVTAEFAMLGLKSMHPISAIQGKGIHSLIETILSLPSHSFSTYPNIQAPIKIAIIGSPNAGKSTLINRLLGETRHIVSDQAGTTRDSLAVSYEFQNQKYALIDTAGIRRLAHIEAGLETESVQQSLQALQASEAVILLIDAILGLKDQDLRLLQYIKESGRAIVILYNKWDALNYEEKLALQLESKRRLRFIPFAKVGFISALKGTGLLKLMPMIQEAYKNATKKLNTAQLTQLLHRAIQKHSPPMIHKRTIKLRYAHPGGYNPPIIVIHGTNTTYLPESYQRYLQNFYHTQLDMTGTPIKLEFKEKSRNKSK